MFKDLMEPEYGEDQSPPDNTRITQVILYYDEPDVAKLKELAKAAMKVEMPDRFLDVGNLSDLYLLILKKYYGNQINTQAPFNGQAM